MSDPRLLGTLSLTLTLTEPLRADLALTQLLNQKVPGTFSDEKVPGTFWSRRAAKGLMEEGAVQVDGRRAAPADVLAPGEHLFVIDLRALDRLRQSARAQPAKDSARLEIVYEDESILVIHKPTGLPSVPHSSDETETAVGLVLARYPELANVGRRGPDSGLEPALLHRLDTGTSGLLVFAKTQPEFERLRGSWRAGSIRKVYRALCRPIANEAHWPEIPTPGQVINLPLAHDAKTDRRMTVVRPGDRYFRGEPLLARTRILQVTSAGNRPDAARDFTIEIETGVMHQIRCHLASLGWPIQGDPVYGGTPSRRLWLHAWRLTLPLATGLSIDLQSRLPESWPKLNSR